jgi:hypothetical protein
MAYEWEEEERRNALRSMTEMDRATACRHARQPVGAAICPDCGERADP